MSNQKNKYSGMTHGELMKAADIATPGKEARLLHRELKKYDDGLFWWDRYPLLVIATVCVFDVLLSVAGALVILKFFGAI